MIEKNLIQFLKFILPNLEEIEEYGYIWVNNPNTGFKDTKYFKTYEEGIKCINKYRNKNNCFIGLATTKNKGNYKKEDLSYRDVIFIDIDEEGLSISDIYNKCKKVGLFAHMVISSGRGWHIYFKLDQFYPIDEIVEVNKYIKELFNSDIHALSSTQIARIPYSINLKNNKYSSIIPTSNPIMPYTLNDLKNHKIQVFKTGNTELEFNTIDDLYCFSQLIKYGVSEGFRNESLKFISSTCKYADISENRALQYALEFNQNCNPPDKRSNVIKVVKSIYNNASIIKPCTQKVAQQLCSSQCRCRIVSQNDILSISNINIDNEVVGLTNRHIIAKNKDKKGVKKHMLEILTGTELTIIAMLKVCNDRLFTKEDIVNFIEVSEPTVRKSLKSLEDKEILITTKQNINKSSKPTILYGYNFKFEKYNKEIVHLNTNLFTAKLQKLIKDNDLKVAIALRYLMKNKQDVTLENISFISGVLVNHINRSLNNLVKAKLIIVNKIKTDTGKCNSYQLFY